VRVSNGSSSIAVHATLPQPTRPAWLHNNLTYRAQEGHEHRIELSDPLVPTKEDGVWAKASPDASPPASGEDRLTTPVLFAQWIRGLP
jgi:hypothetical protein